MPNDLQTIWVAELTCFTKNEQRHSSPHTLQQEHPQEEHTMPLARILAASTSRPVVAAARGRNSNPTYAAVNKKKTSPASKKTMLKRKTASVVNIPRTNESNVVSVRRSYDEDMDRADFTFPSFYTMAGGHPENALSLSPNRKDITETTLQALGLELG
jgi:hypothetical protein